MPEATYPPPLTPEEELRLRDIASDYAISHGLCMRSAVKTSADARPEASHVPVTLFPSAFPKTCFEQAMQVQKTYNELYMKIARDEPFLADIVREVRWDEFTLKLWESHEKVKAEGYVQPLSLGLFRSDYMVHQSESGLQAKQVEFNTISVSFGGLSSKTSELHNFLAATEYPLLTTPPPKLENPISKSAVSLAAGLRAAHEAYTQTTEYPKCILFVAQDGERNVFDQRLLEYYLQQGERVEVFRVPFSEVKGKTEIQQGAKRALLYALPWNLKKVYEVSTVYFRCGYDPSDYPTEEAWDTRIYLERSNAIKCPSLLTQIAGCKKVQQVLATPITDGQSPLGTYLDESDAQTQLLRNTFTNIYPMTPTTPLGQEAKTLATSAESANRFVLKPQREGGGHNIYRGDIPVHLAGIPEEQWGAYILMELIEPPPTQNFVMRDEKITSGGVICELGIYGTALWNAQTGEVLRNEEAGYLLRTKGEKSAEGGVAAGFGCMDSVTLV